MPRATYVLIVCSGGARDVLRHVRDSGDRRPPEADRRHDGAPRDRLDLRHPAHRAVPGLLGELQPCPQPWASCGQRADR